MARKVTSFADKIRKDQESHKNICPTCNAEIQRVMLVRSVKSPNTDSWRFNRTMVNVCKCNEKEVYAA